MAVKNRALTLATRGLLSGAAITIATMGHLQLQSGIAAQDSIHEQYGDNVSIFQKHYLNPQDAYHIQTGADSVIPIIIPSKPGVPNNVVPQGGTRAGVGVTHISYGVPYKYKSDIRFAITGRSYVLFDLAHSNVHNFKSDSDLYLYNLGNEYQTRSITYTVDPDIKIYTDVDNKLDKLHRTVVNPDLTLSTDTDIHVTTVDHTRHSSYGYINYALDSETEFIPATPEIAQPKSVEYDSNHLFVMSGEADVTWDIQEEIDFLMETYIDFRIEYHPYYMIRTEDGVEIRLDGKKDLMLKSDMEMVFNSGLELNQKDEEEAALALLLLMMQDRT